MRQEAKGCKNQLYDANQHVAYCLVDVIRRVGGCSIDRSVRWFGNIARNDARVGKLSSAKSESNERVETRDCHFLNESLRMKALV